MTGRATDTRTGELRAQIDAADDAILAALQRRVAAVRALHDHKHQTGQSLADPGRERAILDRLTARRGDQLSTDGVADLVAAVLAITRAEVARLRGQDWAPGPGK